MASVFGEEAVRVRTGTSVGLLNPATTAAETFGSHEADCPID